MSPHIPRALQILVRERAKFCCEYCQYQQLLANDSFEIDHAVPRSRGGKTSANNLCLACAHCNNGKRSRVVASDPKTGKSVPIFNPRRHAWSEHFQWSDDFGRIVGTTSTGRATVAALQMNRRRIVRLRRFWAAIGLHPPSAQSVPRHLRNLIEQLLSDEGEVDADSPGTDDGD